LRAGDAAIAGTSGLIAGACGHGRIAALVSEPGWLLVAVAVLFAVGLVMRARQRGADGAGTTRQLALAVAFGLAAGAALPAHLPPPNGRVTTHGIAHRDAAGSSDDLFDALEAVDDRPQSFVDKPLSVTGWWRPQAGDVPASVSRPVMTCCAADAVDVGFDVFVRHAVHLPVQTLVRVRGLLRASMHDGETRYAIVDADVQAISEGNSGAR
jgi:DUF1980 C-terminal domain